MAMTTTQTKQHPILFPTPMVKAILEGRKTMTRRVIKLKDGSNPDDESLSWTYEDWVSTTNHNKKIDKVMDFTKTFPYWTECKCPYGEIGAILWVRETWWKGETWLQSDEANTRKETILYRADTTDARPCDVSDEWCINEYGYDKRVWPSWKPSIHMPKQACRLFLRITDIQVERLQGISEEDAKAEGAELYNNYDNSYGGWGAPMTHRDAFQLLWQSINGEDSWNDNPFVWVVEFSRINDITEFERIEKLIKEV